MRNGLDARDTEMDAVLPTGVRLTETMRESSCRLGNRSLADVARGSAVRNAVPVADVAVRPPTAVTNESSALRADDRRPRRRKEGVGAAPLPDARSTSLTGVRGG